MGAETQLRQSLTELGRHLASRGMLSLAVGSLSARIDAKSLLITPSGQSFSLLHPERLLLYGLRAASQEPQAPAELSLHRGIYESRPEIKAIFWARPPVTTALGMAGISPSRCLLPFEIGAMEGEAEASSVAQKRALELLRRVDVLLIERYGAISLGASPEEAFARMEALEQCSQITHLAQSLPPPSSSKYALDKKIALGGSLGVAKTASECSGCGGCGAPKSNIETEAVLASRVAAMFQRDPQPEELPPLVLPPGRRATCGEAWWLEPEKK